MFVAAALVGTAGVIAVANHDDYSKYSEHKNYSDQTIRGRISALEAQINSKRRERQRAERDLQEEEENVCAILADKGILKYGDNLSDTDWRLRQLGNKMRDELESDKEELQQINRALELVNKYQLQHNNHKSLVQTLNQYQQQRENQ